MYGLNKTHKENNPARVITSGCGTAIEFLSISVEKYLYKEVHKINSTIKDTSEMLHIIDDVNNNNNNNNNNMIRRIAKVFRVHEQCRYNR